MTAAVAARQLKMVGQTQGVTLSKMPFPLRKSRFPSNRRFQVQIQVKTRISGKIPRIT